MISQLVALGRLLMYVRSVASAFASSARLASTEAVMPAADSLTALITRSIPEFCSVMTEVRTDVVAVVHLPFVSLIAVIRVIS
ncbi:hypothetical protein D3C86_1775560 [compost metagenome]